MNIRAGFQCLLSVPWVITQNEQNDHPNTKMNKNREVQAMALKTIWINMRKIRKKQAKILRGIVG